MHESPEVAIIQHASGVMQVVHNLFENASKSNTKRTTRIRFSIETNAIEVTYFTEVIYTSIRFATGCGYVGPVSVGRHAQRSSSLTKLWQFVGHNAFLRWKAIQSVSFQEDGQSMPSQWRQKSKC